MHVTCKEMNHDTTHCMTWQASLLPTGQQQNSKGTQLRMTEKAKILTAAPACHRRQ